jgi:hypothetical protein
VPTNDFLEFMNLYIILIDICAIAILGRYLLDKFSNWSGSGASLAIGLWVYIFGHVWVRSWTWAWRYLHSYDISKETPPFTMLSVGLIIISVGLVCIIRVLYTTVNVWSWYILVVLSGVIAVAITLII